MFKIALRVFLLALFCAVCSFSARAARAETFSFAQYGDIHLIGDGTSSTVFLDRLAACIQHGLGAPVDFVVDTGDIYQGGDQAAVYALYRKALDRFGVPAYVLRGNHDDMPGLDAAAWARAMGRDVKFSFNHKGIAFVGFDTAVSSPTWERPAASPETLAWLEAESRKLPEGAPVVLLTHVPLGSRMGLPAVYPLVNRRKVLEIFSKQKVLAVISGHYHGAKESVENGILFTTTPTFSTNRTNHDGTRGGAVRIFTVRDGAITTRLIPYPR